MRAVAESTTATVTRRGGGCGGWLRGYSSAVTESETERSAAGAWPAEKSLERQIRAFHWVRLLAELPDRSAGSDGEREAGGRVFSWMRELGFEEVAEQGVPGARGPGLRLALPLGLAALGCALGGVTGFLAAGAALLSFRREERRDRVGLSRLLPALDSQNVVARAGAERPRRRVVLSASLDAPRTGRLFAASAATVLRGGEGALVWCERALLAGLVVTSASALGATGGLLATAQVGVAGALLVGALLGLEWALAAPGPGANDASGVAALLTCAEQLLAQLPEHTELWLVAAGAGHSGARGIDTFLDAHPEWRSDRTLCLHFDRVGGGALHYLAGERALAQTDYSPRLLELARRLAEGGSYTDVTPGLLVGETDGRRCAARGLACLTLVALEEGAVPRGDHSPDDVVESLDMQTVVRAADFAAAVVVADWRGEADGIAVV